MRRLLASLAVGVAALANPVSASAHDATYKPDPHSAWLKSLGLNCRTPGLGAELLFPVSQVTIAKHRDTVVTADCVTGDSSAFSTVQVFSGTSPAGHPHRIATLLSPSSKWLPTPGVKVISVNAHLGSVKINGAGYSSTSLCNACEDRTVSRTFGFHNGHPVLSSSSVGVIRS